MPIGYWSTLEVHLSIIVACLPSIRALVLRFFPKFSLQSAMLSRDEQPGVEIRRTRSTVTNKSDDLCLENSNSKPKEQCASFTWLDLESDVELEQTAPRRFY